MSGAGGYLSQVVRDARPRAAPSLYAGASAPTVAGVADPLTFARLSHGQPSPDAQSPSRRVAHLDDRAGGEAQPEVEDMDLGTGEAGRSVPVAKPPAQSALQSPPPKDPESDAPEDVSPARPTVRISSARTAEATDRATLKASTIPVSAAVPRPATFDLPDAPTEAAAPPEPRISRGAVKGTATEKETPEVAEGDVHRAPRIRQGAVDRPRAHAFANLQQSTMIGPHHSAQAMPPGSPSVNQADASGGTEVHIGEVEIIVQDPPAPAQPRAARPAPTPPSPARYHIRRF